MPQALPALGALVVGAFSTGAATAMAASAIGSMVLGAIGGAIVGAAIGGLTAAITGGDIGKGMLFGAVGGAVGGGIAGFAAPASTTSTFMGAGTDLATGVTTQQAGAGLIYDSISGEIVGSTAAAAGESSALIGGGGILGGLGNISTGAGMLGKSALDMVAGGMAPEPETAFQYTKEFQEGQWQHEKDMAKLNASLRSSAGGGGGSPLPWSTSEAGVKYQKGMEYKMNTDNNAARMEQLKKQYALERENTKAEWQLGRQVFIDAAGAAASGEYHSGRATMGQAVVQQQNAQKTMAALVGVADQNAAAKGYTPPGGNQ